MYSVQVIPGSEMKKYVLKQFIHNESGQFLIGEIDENLFFMVPGESFKGENLFFMVPGESFEGDNLFFMSQVSRSKVRIFSLWSQVSRL